MIEVSSIVFTPKRSANFFNSYNFLPKSDLSSDLYSDL